MLGRYILSSCVCLSVRPYMSQAGIVPERLDLDHGNNAVSSFLMLNISAKFQCGHPKRGDKIYVV